MRVFLADPALVDLKGHFFTYIQCLVGPFEKAGHTVHVLGNRRLIPEVAEGVGAVPSFTLGNDHQIQFTMGHQLAQVQQRHELVREAVAGLPITPETLRHNAELRYATYDWLTAWQVDCWRDDLAQLDSRFGFTESDLFIVSSLHWPHLIGLVEWSLRRIQDLGRQSLPRFVILLYASLLPKLVVDEARVRGFHHAFDLVTAAGLDQHFLVFTNSAPLKNEYQTITSLPIGVVPTPHTAPRLPDEGQSHAIPGLAFLGTAFRDRGFQFLPQVVEHLMPAIAADRIRVEIQANLPPWNDPLLESARDWLRAAPITLHEGSLPIEDYHDVFKRTDICVLPSLRNQYHSQSSGVFSEAVSFGKVVVVPDGTWMSMTADQYGIGVTFEAGNPASLCQAVQRAFDHLDMLGPRARLAAAEWIRINSPAGFISALAERIPELI